MPGHTNVHDLKGRLLSACFTRYDGALTNGDQANNKLDLEKLQNSENRRLRTQIIRILGRHAMEHNPDFVVGVPNGATYLAEEIASTFGVACVRLVKDPTNSNIYYKSIHDKQAVERYRKGVMIEDVYRKGTNIARSLDVAGMAGKIVGVEAIFDRDVEANRDPVAVPVQSIFNEYIPAILPDESEIWKYAA